MPMPRKLALSLTISRSMPLTIPPSKRALLVDLQELLGVSPAEAGAGLFVNGAPLRVSPPFGLDPPLPSVG